LVKHIFGSEPGEIGDNSSAGNYKFFSAHLLSVPVRSNVRPYYNATSPEVINDFVDFCENAKVSLKVDKTKALLDFAALSGGPFTFDNLTEAMLEGSYARKGAFDSEKLKKVQYFIGESPALFPAMSFEEIMKGMPVIARNHLENGISQNLWYEEVVPRQSRFYFAILYKEKNGDHFSEFTTKLESSLVQIGANSTVGYGYCKINKMQNV
jgi:CRISPR-associated protein Cmr4